MCENTSFGPWLSVAVKKNVGFPSLPKVSVIITCRVPTLAVMGPNVRLAFSREDTVLVTHKHNSTFWNEIKFEVKISLITS